MGSSVDFLHQMRVDTKTMTSDVSETGRKVRELLGELNEEARLWWFDTAIGEGGMSFQIWGPILGILGIVALGMFAIQMLPTLLSSMQHGVSSLFDGGGGGYGHGHHHQRYGNNVGNDGNVVYDDYDYYGGYTPAAAEHYEAKEEVNQIMNSASNMKPSIVSGSSFYSGNFVKPGGHLVQRQIGLPGKN